jgi:ectoine hydroxylase-related dioxygenase (phytanoyl-CoA dioxygenase family)
MPKGSVLVWVGSLWHGGGANKTQTRRVGIAMNYCAGFMRQQENQQLGVPPKLVATFERRLQELIGYSVYNNLIGHIDKRHPAKAILAQQQGVDMVWDLLKPSP